MEIGAFGLAYSFAPALYPLSLVRKDDKIMMPYFWVDVGIFGRVIEKVDNDLFVYETTVTKERATVTAKWVREHLI